MNNTYSTYEAKSHFSELIRKARAGQRIIITHRGQEVAELGPFRSDNNDLGARLQRLEDEGVINPASEQQPDFSPIMPRPGALQRFFAQRE